MNEISLHNQLVGVEIHNKAISFSELAEGGVGELHAKRLVNEISLWSR